MLVSSFRYFAVAALLVCIASGCGPAVLNATRRAAGPLTPPAPNRATIIVAQPNIKYPVVSILDASGLLVGQLSRQSHTVVQVTPGTFRLYVLPENIAASGDRIEGTVVAGKTYYSLIGFRWPGINFTALTPRSGIDWQELAVQTDNPRLELDPVLAQKAVVQLGDIAAVLRQIDARASSLDAAEHEERIIRPDDGL